MVRITVRRSWSFFAINRCRMPAPRSKPSRTTYPVIITATSQNQMKSISQFLLRCRDGIACISMVSDCAGTVHNFTMDQHQKQNCQNGVKPHEAKERKESIAGMDVFRIAFCRSHKTVNEPWLAAKFSGHPAGSVGDIR